VYSSNTDTIGGRLLPVYLSKTDTVAASRGAEEEGGVLEIAEHADPPPNDPQPVPAARSLMESCIKL
jgi:hypothetical protein